VGIIERKYGDKLFEVLYEVEEEHEGFRLDQFAMLHLGGHSREQVKQKIRDKEIVLLGRPGNQRPNTRIHIGERVQLVIERTSQEDELWRGEILPLEKVSDPIYEDDQLIVIAKPPYMATHPSGKHLFNCANIHCENRLGHTVHSVHRLDRETSGVLVLAKNPKSAAIMTDNFENERVRKCYFFIARINEHFAGNDYMDAKERMGPLDDGPKRVFMYTFPENSDEGKSARTFLQVVYKEKGYALGLAFPQTGRQHQIRVHAMSQGLPLVGDKLYLGGYEMFQRFKDGFATEEDHQLMELPRHALHAIALHTPFTGGAKTFIAPFPLDLKNWIIEHLAIEIPALEADIAERVKNYFKSFSK
jgi:RluA family pseudouridine synthase